MAHHRFARLSRPVAIRGLLITSRDLLLLALCIGGLLASWLVYGVSGPGNPAVSGLGRSALSTAPPASKPGPDSAPIGAAAAAEGTPLPAASAPVRVTYPAVGLDVAVHPLRPDPASGASIEPPETLDGYWLSPFGTPGAGSTNTTYVIGHSWEGLDAPFNHLSSAAAAGDVLDVATATGVMTYKVDSVTTYTKSMLKDSPVWTAMPNRLVLISCYTQDLWGKNIVVIASPVTARQSLLKAAPAGRGFM
ncbi:hypothetical protein GCM10027405_03780 [Arthrobacter alkaliphilus]|uniref:class F sortase n=1 Tax=Arthrobacter alkaliphilus TaxID=369936 RepID=UPI001F1C81DE|nr:class F sortase [Arthrobacter alkaliphilus]